MHEYSVSSVIQPKQREQGETCFNGGRGGGGSVTQGFIAHLKQGQHKLIRTGLISSHKFGPRKVVIGIGHEPLMSQSHS